MDDSILSTPLTKETQFSLRYESFLNHFVDEVESLSVYGDQVWDQLFVECDIYLPNQQRPHYHIGWQERRGLGDFHFHLQCAHLVRAGLYNMQEMGDKFYFPDGAGWRKGEEQTANALFSCRGNKISISALFMLALLNSGDRHSPDFSHYIFIEYSYRSSALIPTDKKILLALRKTLYAHLRAENIWHDWAQTCTSLLPVINDRMPRKHVFESGYEFTHYLAEQFVLLSSKVSVSAINIVDDPDKIVMSRIKYFVETNRKNSERFEKVQAEREIEIAVEKEKASKERKATYDALCDQLSEYTDKIPEVFIKFGPLETRWRSLDPKTLETLIWSAPLTLICRMFKKSDNGVRKWAREHRILLTKAGYWAKVRAGKVDYPNGIPDDQYGTQ